METYNGDIIDNIINCNNAYYNGVNEKIENLKQRIAEINKEIK